MQGECPRCHEKIDSVDAEGYVPGVLMPGGYIEEEPTEWIVFTCPRCGEEIIEGEDNIEKVREAVWGPPSS